MKIYRPERDDIADLRTVRAFPTRDIGHLDPFLLLNHHGHQIYPPHNRGMPFGPHPHRGFETVTFVIKGDVSHRDSGGGESVIKAGGIQWMTAGKGVVHEEVSSQEFKDKGGELLVLQLWVNLPARLKMTEPRYIGKQASELLHLDEVTLISGEWKGHKGPVPTLTDITLMTVNLKPQNSWSYSAIKDHTVLFYLVEGSLIINSERVEGPGLVEFKGEDIYVRAESDSLFIFGHALPFNEPIVAYGPFVMNTREEILQAIKDFS